MTNVGLVLDTDVLIEILRGSHDAGIWLQKNGHEVIGLPVFVYMEALMGAESKKEFSDLKNRLAEFVLLETTSEDAVMALAWFEQFRISNGIGILDCFIGAAAKRAGVPLYTFNHKHYGILHGVQVREPYKR